MSKLMNIEHVCADATVDGGEGLIATIIRSSSNGTRFPQGITFLTSKEQPQQVGVMRHPKGTKIPAHKHIPYTRTVERTHEVIIVKSGVVDLHLYDSNWTFIKTCRLLKDDIAILVAGGHGFNVIDECQMIEVKQGPYIQEKDKEQLK